ncbi:hypothetical protein HanRHA438_Chr02g0063481 [Helianthus annuus]|nr:hypothetical protein HanRHA438_Chr02g0063481 [Helianthus annuus]
MNIMFSSCIVDSAATRGLPTSYYWMRQSIFMVVFKAQSYLKIPYSKNPINGCKKRLLIRTHSLENKQYHDKLEKQTHNEALPWKLSSEKKY